MNFLRRRFPLVLLFLSLSALAGGAATKFDIPAQPLPEALRLFADQAKMQLLYKPSAISGGTSNALVGDYENRAALQRLLKDTGFEVVFTTRNSATIRPVRTDGKTISGEESPRHDIQLSQAGTAVSAAAQAGEVNRNDANDDERAAKVQEIVVTAQKRIERLQDVPISISVLSGGDLDKSSDRGVAEALNRIPGVLSTAGSQERFGSASTVVIRGVAPVGGAASTTAYYLDGIPFGFARFAFAPDSNAYDLERIEALRGPQGTLYGASALNGVIRVLTEDADLDKLEFKARASTSTVDHGAQSYRGDMTVNVPLIGGKLATRAVFGYQDERGWIDKPIRKDINDREVTNARLKVNARPTDRFTVGASAWISRADQGGGSYSSVGGLHNVSTAEEPSSVDYDAYGLRLGYDFTGVSLSSSTSYIEFENNSLTDYFPVFGLQDTLLNTRFASQVFSQEITLNSTHEGPWRWSMGGMYRDAEELLYQLRRQYVAPTGTNQGTFSESFAMFGEVTRGFRDGRFEVTGGLRYFEDRIRDVERSRLNFINGTVNPLTGLPGLVPDQTTTFDKVTPRLVFSWHPVSRSTLYASYAEGFRSGLSQLPAIKAAAPQFQPAEPDELRNYELGAKGSLWDGRLSFDTALFYIDWQGVQQTLNVEVVPTVILPALVNGESVSGAGVEVGITAEAADGLTLGLNFSWNDLKLDGDVVPAGGPVVFRKGDRLIGSPETTVGASVDYAFALGGGYGARLSTSANYISETINGRTIAATFYKEAILLMRASVAIESPNGWVTSIFADNLGDERGLVEDAISPAWNTYGRPRTVGLQLEYRFQ